MIRIGRLTDYAVVILSRLTLERETLRSAADLASDTGVPEPTVAKVLKMLARADLVESHRGAGGGYRLAHTPESITMADVITVMEGPIALTACVDGHSGACDQEALCPIRGNWDQVNSAIKAALDAVTLADMRANRMATLGKASAIESTAPMPH